MINTSEIERACQKLSIKLKIFANECSASTIKFLIEKFEIYKTTGHLAINNGQSFSIPLENNEFTYSKFLMKEPVYLFFDQLGKDKGVLLWIEDSRQVCSILEECFGMEYFLVNQELTYLLAVNWYVIEGVGSPIEWMMKIDS